jgi:hypothetical protein
VLAVQFAVQLVEEALDEPAQPASAVVRRPLNAIADTMPIALLR